MGSSGKPACVEEADSEGEAVPHTKRRATKKESSKGARSSRSSQEKKSSRSDSGYSSQTPPTGSNSSSPISQKSELAKDKSVTVRDDGRGRKSSGSSGTSTKSPQKSSKPPSAHRNKERPSLNTNIAPTRTRNDPSYYGHTPGGTPIVTQTALPIRTRPSAPVGSRPRPNSFYGMPTQPYDNRPPLSRSAQYTMSSSPSVATSYPSPHPMQYMTGYATPPTESYFAQIPTAAVRPLAERFASDPIMRPSSAAAIRQMTEDIYRSNGFEPQSAVESPYRRGLEQPQSAIESQYRRGNALMSKAEKDALMMPPPSLYRRPGQGQTAVVTMPGAYPPEDYEEQPYDSRQSQALFVDVQPAPTRRPSIHRYSTYDNPPTTRRIEVAGKNRRQSYYDSVGQSSNASYEEKVRMASGYQNEVTGGPPRDLTAAALREKRRETGSSRSTRSARSHTDDSEVRRSATTRTTRSGSGHEEDVTIKLKGNGTVNIAGAEISYKDGTEVNILRRHSLRDGSERSPSEFGSSQYIQQSPVIEDRRAIRDSRSRDEDRRSIRDGRRRDSSRAPSKSRRSSSRAPPTIRYVDEQSYYRTAPVPYPNAI